MSARHNQLFGRSEAAETEASIMFGWIVRRFFLALPFIFFRRSFFTGMAVWLAMRKLMNGNDRSMQRSGSTMGQRRW